MPIYAASTAKNLQFLALGTGVSLERNVRINCANLNLRAKPMPSQPDSELAAKEATLFDRTFRDSEGNITIAQAPNLPILVGVTAAFLQYAIPSGQLQRAAELVAFGALFTWAWQELLEGVNYFRQALGLVGLLGLIALGLNALSL